MLSLLMSVHDDSCHYEEANVSQENQNDWSDERPNELCYRIQIAPAKKNYKAVRALLRKMQISSNIILRIKHSRLLITIVISLIHSYFLTPSKAQRYCETTNIE